jgi:putative lysine transport system permease protein
MSSDQLPETTDAPQPDAPEQEAERPARHKGRLVTFVTATHRYVLLGTSAFALLGVLFYIQPASSWSFLGGIADVLVGLCLGWMVFSLIALIYKLTHWSDYGQVAPMTKPKAALYLRYVSYVIWACVIMLFIDRGVMGFCSLVESAIASDTNPTDFLSSAVYMVYESRTIFASGILTTIELAVFGTVIAFGLALLMCFLRIQTPDRSDNDASKFLKVVGCGFAKVYSTIVRGTPMMVQGLIIYFAGFAAFKGTGMSVTQITGVWSFFVAGLVTISLKSTAYMMEVLRSGIEAVDPGQAEAARSLGLSQWQAMSKVVFPQGIKNAIPALSNELVINIKDSSVLSVIGVFDLMYATTTVAGIYYRQMEVYCVAAVCYLILTMVASKLLTIFSNKLDVAQPDAVPSSN